MQLKRLVGRFSGSGRQRHLVDYIEAVPLQGDYFSGVVGQHSQILQPQIDQNLRADAAFMLQQSLSGQILIQLAARVIQNLGQQSGSRRGGIDPKSTPGVMQV